MKTLTEQGFRLIGTFGVDSGQAMITDPCYLDKWKPWDSKEEPFENHKEKAGEYGYLGAAGLTLSKGYGQFGLYDGVVFTTGIGDGVYPVYARFENIGTPEMPDERIAQVVIDFFGEFDPDGELED